MLDIAYNHEPELLIRAAPQHHDKDLLLKVAEGDEHAFRCLFIMHHQQLGVHIHRITNSIELAEEVVQDVFLKIWMARETLAQVEDFKAYLFVISKNHALNCLKKLAKEKVQAKKLEESSLGLIMDDQQDNLYYNLLDEAIDHLPSQQQKVYLLSRHNRLKYNEIADQLKLSRETVKKYLQIATTSITDYVRSHLDVYSVVLLAIKTFFIFFQKR
ncbi:sigma-70 family RNA polymerase sigma factor [Mucilaginibacter sp. KACC 22773]|jgi:RNA polymerase sigma-70 factor (ECF subfamily)|uniref:sigma-70 family RNA polymerase sigma factor n=1 Tax=Mucilaginibacter sp. KACC 22773 TaxID=3025671 RepID=UPI00236690A4|nr:sigma-70 family RNA polymerase sigma factor [Mucilaginibacter sp. KACC 22773]WDF80255.1 sigma-70 family RNA polymerase sigma factor [Mucilaginibacter sp. KACC 22773]